MASPALEGRFDSPSRRSDKNERQQQLALQKRPDQSGGEGEDDSVLLFHLKVARRRAEQDALLLANRLALLKAEEEKALKKIEETKRRANEILECRKRNEQKESELDRVRQEREQMLAMQREKFRHQREINEQRAQERHAELQEDRRDMRRQVESERQAIHEMTKEARQREEEWLQQRNERIRREREEAKRERHKREDERRLQAKENFDHKCDQERLLRRMKEEQIAQMEQEELALIQRLYQTQQRQRAAYEQLEGALVPSEGTRARKPVGTPVLATGGNDQLTPRGQQREKEKEKQKEGVTPLSHGRTGSLPKDHSSQEHTTRNAQGGGQAHQQQAKEAGGTGTNREKHSVAGGQMASQPRRSRVGAGVAGGASKGPAASPTAAASASPGAASKQWGAAAAAAAAPSPAKKGGAALQPGQVTGGGARRGQTGQRPSNAAPQAAAAKGRAGRPSQPQVLKDGGRGGETGKQARGRIPEKEKETSQIVDASVPTPESVDVSSLILAVSSKITPPPGSVVQYVSDEVKAALRSIWSAREGSLQSLSSAFGTEPSCAELKIRLHEQALSADEKLWLEVSFHPGSLCVFRDGRTVKGFSKGGGKALPGGRGGDDWTHDNDVYVGAFQAEKRKETAQWDVVVKAWKVHPCNSPSGAASSGGEASVKDRCRLVKKHFSLQKDAEGQWICANTNTSPNNRGGGGQPDGGA
uniref:Uncharacterized protein n=1 Tax=Chromera velia CCMP2878 TaxID=1169474 RepID=A0A0G4HIN2_9ALVE|eukprot:Cvel_7023.t1-p1 / transcript=Cvel_7023.t1 / gene=Cvel_7023 / organism=Chromera_velia_CCMP2878 / gene_product=Trichohyalin, putative / transcript_product=Trichohyalin, putative / location=Cvel_scaffold358:15059-17524(+) / protein_length=702 / sequence_SO=supercontig / SO=protein_coding / is_pseudo=false